MLPNKITKTQNVQKKKEERRSMEKREQTNMDRSASVRQQPKDNE